MLSDLNFYKIAKVKRKVNENVMIRILQFFIPTKNLIKMFKDTHREKNTVKLNSSAYKKYKFGHLSRWYIKLTLFKRL